MKVQVEVKSNYGNEAIYPYCETAKTFADIAGTKTLTRETLKKIKRLGFRIVHAPRGRV